MSTDSNQNLAGKVALITGGTSGIGRDTAILFARHGAKVVLTGRRAEEGNETAKLARGAGGEVLFLQGDVSKTADVKMFVEKTVEKFGRLDVAFNNAGIEGKWTPIVELPEEIFTLSTFASVTIPSTGSSHLQPLRYQALKHGAIRPRSAANSTQTASRSIRKRISNG